MSDVARALDELRAGRPVVLPTETVYGLAARPTAAGIAALFRLKARTASKPIPVLGAGVDALAGVVRFDDGARRIAARFWPGPLTVVLPRAEGFDVDLGGAGEPGVAVRVPDDAVALEVLSAAGVLAVTSANRSGEAPAGTVAEARATFGDGVAVYVDAGPRHGRPSTLLSLLGVPRLLRGGPVDAAGVLACLGAPRP